MYGFFPGSSLVVNSIMRWPTLSAITAVVALGAVADKFIPTMMG